MEYLSGDEFSVYVLANKGKMLYCIQNLRQKLNQHYSFEALTVKNKQITEMCKKITNELKLDYNVNIQFKNSKNDQPKLIEINPVSYTHLTLPTKAWCRSRWSPFH